MEVGEEGDYIPIATLSSPKCKVNMVLISVSVPPPCYRSNT